VPSVTSRTALVLWTPVHQRTRTRRARQWRLEAVRPQRERPQGDGASGHVIDAAVRILHIARAGSDGAEIVFRQGQVHLRRLYIGLVVNHIRHAMQMQQQQQHKKGVEEEAEGKQKIGEGGEIGSGSCEIGQCSQGRHDAAKSAGSLHRDVLE